MNCVHMPLDVARSRILGDPRVAAFTREERENFSTILEDTQLTDAFRYLHPYTVDTYTFWANGANRRARNEGWRLDYFLISNQLLPKLKCVTHN